MQRIQSHSPSVNLSRSFWLTSGGAQVPRCGSPPWRVARFRSLCSPLGCFCTDGFNVAERVYHLQAETVEDIGILFPSRWPSTVGSAFNQASQGDYTALISGPHNCDGPTGYFGKELVSKWHYVDLTFQQVNQLPIWSVQKLDGKYVVKGKNAN